MSPLASAPCPCCVYLTTQFVQMLPPPALASFFFALPSSYRKFKRFTDFLKNTCRTACIYKPNNTFIQYLVFNSQYKESYGSRSRTSIQEVDMIVLVSLKGTAHFLEVVGDVNLQGFLLERFYFPIYIILYFSCERKKIFMVKKM